MHAGNRLLASFAAAGTLTREPLSETQTVVVSRHEQPVTAALRMTMLDTMAECLDRHYSGDAGQMLVATKLWELLCGKPPVRQMAQHMSSTCSWRRANPTRSR